MRGGCVEEGECECGRRKGVCVGSVKVWVCGCL